LRHLRRRRSRLRYAGFEIPPGAGLFGLGGGPGGRA